MWRRRRTNQSVESSYGSRKAGGNVNRGGDLLPGVNADNFIFGLDSGAIVDEGMDISTLLDVKNTGLREDPGVLFLMETKLNSRRTNGIWQGLGFGDASIVDASGSAGVRSLAIKDSNHALIILDLLLDWERFRTPFRYLDAWTRDESCKVVIKEALAIVVHDIKSFRLVTRLKNIRRCLIKWNKTHFRMCKEKLQTSLCLPLDGGGLNFKKFEDVNLALVAKLGWMLAKGEDSLWIRVFKVKYWGNDVSLLWSLDTPKSLSFGARSIFATRDFIQTKPTMIGFDHFLWWVLDRIRSMAADLALAWAAQSDVGHSLNALNDFLLHGDHVVFVKAASKGLCSATVIVITDSDGVVVEAFSVRLEAKSPLEVETWALFHAVQRYKIHGWFNVNFASECQTLVL
uniref:RNase H type-1 domain-containing protein n=1 Tax=Cannabis sativa TaxID=3483 RepID=A0A803QF76_CANSA